MIREDVIEMIFRGSLTLTAMLVAIIGFLLTQYASLIKAPDYMRKPYRRLAILIVIVLVMSAITSLLSLFHLLGMTEFISSEVFSAIIILQVIAVVFLAVGVLVTTFSTLRRTSG